MFLSCPVVHPFVRSWVLRLVLLIQYFEWFWCKLAQVVYWARAWNGQLSGSRGERSRLYEVSERWTAVRGIIVDPLSQVGFLIYSVSVFLLHAFILFVCKVPDNFWGVGVQWTIYQFLYFNCNYCATTCFSEFLFPKTWNWLGCTITLCLSLRLLLLFFLMIFDDRLWLVGEVSTAARWYTLRQYPRLLRHLRAARNVSFLTGICVLIIKYLVTVLLHNDHKTTISDEQRYVRNYNVGVHAVQLITIFVSSFATMKFWLFNPSETRVQRYYSATSNTMKWVRWPLMGGLLHLVQRGGDCVGPQPAEAPSRCTNCNSPLINGQCTNHRIAV